MLTGWLMTEGAGLLLGFLAKLLTDLWNDKRSREALQELGRKEVAAKTNAETLETRDAMDRVARPSDDAVARSLRDGTF